MLFRLIINNRITVSYLVPESLNPKESCMQLDLLLYQHIRDEQTDRKKASRCGCTKHCSTVLMHDENLNNY